MLKDRGYRILVSATIVLSVGAAIDFWEETVWGEFLQSLFIGSYGIDEIILLLFYLPGTIAVGFGLASWLPDIRRLAKEIDRREVIEEEFRDLLEESEKLAQGAEIANQAKSEFLATMSHELRTPLNAIIGFSSMLKDGYFQDDQVKSMEYVADINKAGTHLLRLINDILDLSKVEAGKLTKEITVFDVTAILSDCVSFMHPMILNRQQTMDEEIEPYQLESDQRLLRQILINLLSNASKYSPPDTQISLSGKFMAGRGYVLTIQDQGYGMAPGELERAMQPFVQLEHSLTRTQEGTGLGLHLVQRFCDELGVTMSIESIKNSGTIVTLTFDQQAMQKEISLQMAS